MKFFKISKKNLIGVIIAVLVILLISLAISASRNSSSEEEYDEEFNFPQSETELSAVPENLKSSSYLGNRGVGACNKLLGEVHVTVIFVEDSESKWNENDLNAFKSETEATFKRMEEDAKAFGKTLNMESDYRNTKVMVPFIHAEFENWADTVLASLDMSAYSDANLSLEREFGCDEAVIIFALNYDGRSFTANSENAEYTIIFADAPAIYHEICHVFGAEDLYYPEEVEKIAEKYINNSIMYNCYEGEVDDFTAYIIGWQDSLTESAEDFLENTMHITREQLNEARLTS